MIASLLFAFAIGSEWMAAREWSALGSPMRFFAWHLLSSAFVVTLGIMASRRRREHNLALFCSGIWIAFPVFGIVPSTLLAWKLRDNEVPSGATLEVLGELMEEEAAFFKDLAFGVQARKYMAVSQRESLLRGHVEPLADILRSKDFEAKKRVISKLRNERSAAAIRLLKVAQKDSLYEFQYLATVALTSIEQDWIEDIQRLEREIVAEPMDPSCRRNILEVYHRMMATGLVSGKITAVFLAQAETHAKAALELFPEDADIRIELGKLALLKGDAQAAREHLEAAVERRPESAVPRFWLAQALYTLVDLKGVSAQMGKLADLSDWTMDMMPYIEYWSEEAKADA